MGTLQSWILRTATMSSTRWTVFGTARFLQRSQKSATCRKSALPRCSRVPESLQWQFDPSESWAGIRLFYCTFRLSQPLENHNLEALSNQSSNDNLQPITPDTSVQPEKPASNKKKGKQMRKVWYWSWETIGIRDECKSHTHKKHGWAGDACRRHEKGFYIFLSGKLELWRWKRRMRFWEPKMPSYPWWSPIWNFPRNMCYSNCILQLEERDRHIYVTSLVTACRYITNSMQQQPPSALSPLR